MTGADEAGRDDAFISYAREDAVFVQRLREALVSREKRVWVDLEDIPPTADWRAKVYAGIESSKAFVVVLSPASSASKVCGEELEHALELKKRLVPLVFSRVDPDSLRPELTAPNWISFEDDAGFDGSLATLVKALETDLAWLDAHARYTVLAGDWLRRDRDASLLLRGRDLAGAERWLAESASHHEAATDAQVDFILAGRRAAGRRRRLLFAAVVAALGVSIGLGVVALLQRNQAVDRESLARSQALAAAAVGQLDVDPELSVLLAREAVGVRATPQTVDALRRSLIASRVRVRLRDPGGLPVSKALFSPDGKRVLTVAGDSPPELVAGVWDARTGTRIRLLRARAGELSSVAVSPDGTHLVTWNADSRTAGVWSIAAGRQTAALHDERPFFDASFSADGRTLVTAGGGAAASLWRSSDGARLATFGSARGVAAPAAALSPDGSLVLAASGGRAWIWRASGGKPIATIKAGSEVRPVVAVRFSPDGGYFATEQAARFPEDRVQSRVRLWQTEGARQLAVLDTGAGFAGDLAFGPDDKLLVTAGPGESPHLWAVPGGSLVAVLAGHAGAVDSVAFSADGSRLVTASDDGTARVWDLRTHGSVAVLRGHAARVASAAFSPDGRRVLTAGDDGTARIWQIEEAGPILRGAPLGFGPGGRLVLTSTALGARGLLWDAATGRLHAVLSAAKHRVVAGAFSPDGSLVATGSGSVRISPRVVAYLAGEHAVRIWRTADGRPVAVLPTDSDVTNVAFSSDGKLLLAGGLDEVEVWQLPSGRLLRRLRAAHGAAAELEASFSFDGSRMLTVGEPDGVRVWATAKGRPLRLMADSSSVVQASFDHEARLVVGTGGDASWARLWDAASGKIRRVLLRGGATGTAFSPDGGLVAAGSEDGTARVWSTVDGRLVSVLAGHTGSVDVVAFSPDGRLVVTSGRDGTSRLWEASTGENIAVYDTPSAGFSPDGSLVETPSPRSVQLLPCETCGPVHDLLALAGRRVTRGLTCEERRVFLGRRC